MSDDVFGKTIAGVRSVSPKAEEIEASFGADESNRSVRIVIPAIDPDEVVQAFGGLDLLSQAVENAKKATYVLVDED